MISEANESGEKSTGATRYSFLQLLLMHRTSQSFFDGFDTDEDELTFPTLSSNNSNQKNNSNSNRLANSLPAHRKSRPSEQEEALSEDVQQKLQLLFDMGFPDRAENLEALRVSNRDVASAIDFMMAKNLEDII